MVRAQLSQDDRLCLDTVLTLGRLPDGEPDGGKPAEWDAGTPLRSIVGFQDAVAFRPPAEVIRVALMDRIELRLDPETFRSMTTLRPSGRGELRGWISVPGDEPFDSISLQLAVDAMPPATFDIHVTGWVPTLQLTSYIRALPVPGPVQILHRAHLIAKGRVDESFHVWDSAGRLVAHSMQLAAIRLPEGRQRRIRDGFRPTGPAPTAPAGWQALATPSQETMYGDEGYLDYRGAD